MKKVNNSNMEHIQFMNDVARDIIFMKITDKDNIKTMYKKFFNIMKKYNIKQGVKEGNGTTICNPIWTMCECLFTDRYKAYVSFYTICSTAPKEIKSYEKGELK